MLDMTGKSLFPDWEQKIFFNKKDFVLFSFEKRRIVPKNEKGDPLGFINIHSVAKYQKTRRGTLLRHWGTICSKFALAELGLSKLISFCKKWYIRDEVCGLTKKEKKLATVIVGLFP